MSVTKIAGAILGSAALVAGHGYVTGAVVDGTYHGGFIVDTYNYQSDYPDNIGWYEDATDNGFVDGSSYSSGDIICHKDGKPGAISAPVKAGGEVELQWTEWPESHHGPVITYLANCNGDCSSVDKTKLEFFKIDAAGLIDDSNVPGTWASDNLISNNNSYTVTIPSSIKSGNYVMRHEIIALHSAGETNGAQNYPQCINLKVTGGGSDSPSGTLGTALYKNTDAGIKVNIYQSLSNYEIPGPALYTGASSNSGSSGSSASTTAAASAATTTAASVAPVSSSATPTATVQGDNVTVTATPNGQSQQSSTPSSGSSSSGSSSSGSSSSDSSSSDASSYNSDDWSSYLSSLSAEQFLNMLRQTVKWLVTDKKHARDLSK
ncbi:endoglucanase [Penicillium hetheringtonii]|uniref:Endoglucanase n=1 Tax=Penicillium hetheringtonii TaxID=911720 RepID=A0AAD6GQP6_9EURO|nr:endoglucanase [Penicillium hetheringtonii]